SDNLKEHVYLDEFSLDTLKEEIVSLMNTEGGFVFCGIDDNAQSLTLLHDQDNKTKLKLYNMLISCTLFSKKFSPYVKPFVYVYDNHTEQKNLIVFSVAKIPSLYFETQVTLKP